MGLFSKKIDPELLYETSYLGSSIRVFKNRVDFKIIAGRNSIPIDQIAGIETGMLGLWQITIETTGGKKYKIPTTKKKEVRDAIFKAQSMNNQSSSSNTLSVGDELAKLAQLKSQGLLSDEEFEIQKKKLLE